MAELKTQKNEASVAEFLNRVEPERKRADAKIICMLMQEATGAEAKMWGSTIIGFGEYTYTYESGRTGDWMLVGFSPRKQNLTLYIMPGFEHYEDLLAKLGKHKTGKSCLYINKLADVDLNVLKELITQSVEHMKATNPQE
ncbi:MAG: DUF1801 domain-containing protein [Caldilineaceae bacterium]